MRGFQEESVFAEVSNSRLLPQPRVKNAPRPSEARAGVQAAYQVMRAPAKITLSSEWPMPIASL
jgi:hypothetical protein